jgi:signal transduction histidine kinase
MDSSLDPDQRQLLENMSSEVGRLIRLTSNLLYMAHAEAGRDVVRRPVDLDGLCLEVMHQEQHVRDDVNLRFDHDEHVSVSGDRDLLKQLLLNIVDNAVKFSPSGGEVLLGLGVNGASVEISVQDQGPGIPPDQLERIFERFQRGAQTGSRTVGGAGIGLAISRWIARAHGGDVRAESGGEPGSRFVINLPLPDEDGAAETDPGQV